MACRQYIMIRAEPLGSYAPPFISIHPELIVFQFYFFTDSSLCDDYPLGFNSFARSPSSRPGARGQAIHMESALMRWPPTLQKPKTHGRASASPDWDAGSAMRGASPQVP